MVYVKKALSPRAQEAIDLIAGNAVFHTVRDDAGIQLFAAAGNATVSLSLPLVVWSEIRPLVEFIDQPLHPVGGDGVQPVLVLTDRRVSGFADRLPRPSNEGMAAGETPAEQLDLPLVEISEQDQLEAAGQQRLDFGG